MSMLDAFFSRGFKASKCKTLLKLTLPRIKLLRNRRETQVKQMRRDIANLLQNGQEATARIRVEHIIREENMMAAQEILELFCELVAVRIPIIETQRECPLDLKEAISSICFAAPRCADLPELQQVLMLFATKYGKEFVTAATELMPDCGVNRQIIELLSIRAPPAEIKLKLLKEIAEEHEIDWDPTSTETEFLKPHEDLLNGPVDIITGSKLPLPKDKHEEQLSSTSANDSLDQDSSDADSDFLDLPEVPKTAHRQSPEAPSAPEMLPTFPASPDLQPENETTNDASVDANVLHITGSKPDTFTPDPSLSSPLPSADASFSTVKDNRHHVPFVSSPTPFPPHPAKKSEPAPTFSCNQSEINIDLQDVLAAAQAAAESADRAAAAARSAASLAQVKITELVMKKNSRAPATTENEFHVNFDDRPPEEEKPVSDRDHRPVTDFDAPNAAETQYRSSLDPDEKAEEFQPAFQPSRSTSMEDNPYLSYPNLFSRQESDLNRFTSDISRMGP
ncbi:hypothetical protein QJS10_CPA09g00471 [Acorus calamus]|uniref:IST1-like protein n=1 Tax=Acorus calamus TaxID=4465 RepID=A0AAV9E6T3_ACOCL|nr:hypothetical protein QJS10_CPA09g00471 [Acorus calamus]